MVNLILFMIGTLFILGIISCLRFLREWKRLEKLGIPQEDIKIYLIDWSWKY